jgi:hypothetical protein
MHVPNWLGSVLESPYLALIVALVFGALALSGHFSTIANCSLDSRSLRAPRVGVAQNYWGGRNSRRQLGPASVLV